MDFRRSRPTAVKSGRLGRLLAPLLAVEGTAMSIHDAHRLLLVTNVQAA